MNKNPPEIQDQDNLYSQPREAIAGFVFDDAVVKVFEDMIGRSVPGYTTLLLGCSLGAATLAMQQGIGEENVKFMAIDNSQAMIDACQTLTSQHKKLNVNVCVELADINNVNISNASLVMMNFTLQFIAKKLRQDLIGNIYQGLNAGGVMVLSEKIKMENASDQKRLTTLHHAFKKANGYSALEISQKRSALENVLIAETIEQHMTRLKQAGFSEVLVWFQCFNFVSFLAIK